MAEEESVASVIDLSHAQAAAELELQTKHPEYRPAVVHAAVKRAARAAVQTAAQVRPELQGQVAVDLFRANMKHCDAYLEGVMAAAADGVAPA